MLRIKKKNGKIVQAYKLGTENERLEQLITEGKIIDFGNGSFEVFSQEAVKSESGHGQVAYAGDWIRLDGADYPYPSKNEWFQENMRHINGDDYEQIPKELVGWTADMDMCPEVDFLIREKGLELVENNYDKYFSASLWGNPEVADRNAVLVFYNINYDNDGNVMDAEFNFVERTEFDRTYDVIRQHKSEEVIMENVHIVKLSIQRNKWLKLV